MKKIIWLLLFVFVISGCTLKFNQDITEDEFTKHFLTDSRGEQYCYCLEPSQKLTERCEKVNGDIYLHPKTYGGGRPLDFVLGCFPEEKSLDKGQDCRLDVECEGLCIVSRSDNIFIDEFGRWDDSAFYSCSDFKKPLFSYPVNDEESFFPCAKLCK